MEIMPIQTPGMAQDGLSGPSANLEDSNFAKVLRDAAEAVNHLQQEADAATRDFAVGQSQSLHETMITLQKADLSLRLLTQVRNKAVEAYHEVMRMQI
jgi:flagellar hook-basal body complex protein FliE